MVIEGLNPFRVTNENGMKSLAKEDIEILKKRVYGAYGYFGKKTGLNCEDLLDVVIHNYSLAAEWNKSRLSDENYNEDYDHETELPGIVGAVTYSMSLNTGKKINDFEKYVKFLVETYFKFRDYYLTVSKKTDEDIDVNALASVKARDEIIEIINNDQE